MDAGEAALERSRGIDRGIEFAKTQQAFASPVEAALNAWMQTRSQASQSFVLEGLRSLQQPWIQARCRSIEFVSVDSKIGL